jgi:hypothetical protein
MLRLAVPLHLDGAQQSAQYEKGAEDMKPDSSDLLVLQIRDCISRREYITAVGNYELHHFGAWQSNWSVVNNEIEQELSDLWKKANNAICAKAEKDPKPMLIAAELRIVELSDSDIETMKTMYAVRSGETVEDLLRRVGLTGTSLWHYSQAEIRIKLVKE